jgi:hypothetical protein
VGSPEIATATVPVKPFTGVVFTLICCPAPPGTSAIVAGVEDNEKSAGDLGLPLQDIKTKHKARLEHAHNTFEEKPMSAILVDQRHPQTGSTAIGASERGYISHTL